jgi:hypothetical protein
MELEDEITCVAIGELKAQSLPTKIKSHYIIAVGCLNYVVLHCLNPFTLDTFYSGTKYVIRHSLQIEKVMFV